MLPVDIDAVMTIETSCFSLPYERELFENFVGRMSREPVACWGFVAESSAGHIAGYCISDADSSSPITVRVLSLGTAAMYRGQGVGFLLLKHCISCARLCGASSVQLHVAVDNVAALGLYKRLGFAAVRKLVAYYRCSCCARSTCSVFKACCHREANSNVDAWQMRLAL
jgi:ribosomal-protein-alanine N-acetyltransferase